MKKTIAVVLSLLLVAMLSAGLRWPNQIMAKRWGNTGDKKVLTRKKSRSNQGKDQNPEKDQTR